MKFLTMLVAMGVALLFSACAYPTSPQVLPVPVQEQADPTFAVATLAPLGSFEFEAAPAFTRNALLRHRSAALARAGRIEVATLKSAIVNCDRARVQLDAALAADQAYQITRAHQLLEDAISIINNAEAELNAGVK